MATNFSVLYPLKNYRRLIYCACEGARFAFEFTLGRLSLGMYRGWFVVHNPPWLLS